MTTNISMALWFGLNAAVAAWCFHLMQMDRAAAASDQPGRHQD